ncbi:hypothetical protein PAPYR_491 [Paratrimastix pyriformis]|uniref:Exonuclease domain-containing protein n=1 Tax=Paratrimastix pyriformis TaxID=342808 RepID=A0ABQ8UTR4_9EUKA|nr:hypothetical protein PAPYR_491 [Paratrimastix pyriformis]
MNTRSEYRALSGLKCGELKSNSDIGVYDGVLAISVFQSFSTKFPGSPAFLTSLTMLNATCFIVVDTETTGCKKTDRIVEIGAVELVCEPGSYDIRVGRSFHRFANPSKRSCEAAEKIHGIYSDFLAPMPPVSMVMKEFLQFIHHPTDRLDAAKLTIGADIIRTLQYDHPEVIFPTVAPPPKKSPASPRYGTHECPFLVAHNASFDATHINQELELCGADPIDLNRWLCTKELLHLVFPEFLRASLDFAVGTLGIFHNMRQNAPGHDESPRPGDSDGDPAAPANPAPVSTLPQPPQPPNISTASAMAGLDATAISASELGPDSSVSTQPPACGASAQPTCPSTQPPPLVPTSTQTPACGASDQPTCPSTQPPPAPTSTQLLACTQPPPLVPPSTQPIACSASAQLPPLVPTSTQPTACSSSTQPTSTQPPPPAPRACCPPVGSDTASAHLDDNAVAAGMDLEVTASAAPAAPAGTCATPATQTAPAVSAPATAEPPVVTAASCSSSTIAPLAATAASVHPPPTTEDPGEPPVIITSSSSSTATVVARSGEPPAIPIITSSTSSTATVVARSEDPAEPPAAATWTDQQIHNALGDSYLCAALLMTCRAEWLTAAFLEKQGRPPSDRPPYPRFGPPARTQPGRSWVQIPPGPQIDRAANRIVYSDPRLVYLPPVRPEDDREWARQAWDRLLGYLNSPDLPASHLMSLLFLAKYETFLPPALFALMTPAAPRPALPPPPQQQQQPQAGPRARRQRLPAPDDDPEFDDDEDDGPPQRRTRRRRKGPPPPGDLEKTIHEVHTAITRLLAARPFSDVDDLHRKARGIRAITQAFWGVLIYQCAPLPTPVAAEEAIGDDDGHEAGATRPSSAEADSARAAAPAAAAAAADVDSTRTAPAPAPAPAADDVTGDRGE